MYRLLGRKSKLSVNNKLLIYNVILKPIWTYGIQLWGTTCNSNIEILERFQSKVLWLIVDAPWYVSNFVICNDLQILTVKEEISRFSSHYNVRISVHPNELVASLTESPIQSASKGFGNRWRQLGIETYKLELTNKKIQLIQVARIGQAGRGASRGVLLSTLLQDNLHTSHHLLNVLLQIANKLGLSNKKNIVMCRSLLGYDS
jgi:hypothetical protein